MGIRRSRPKGVTPPLKSRITQFCVCSISTSRIVTQMRQVDNYSEHHLMKIRPQILIQIIVIRSTLNLCPSSCLTSCCRIFRRKPKCNRGPKIIKTKTKTTTIKVIMRLACLRQGTRTDKFRITKIRIVATIMGYKISLPESSTKTW